MLPSTPTPGAGIERLSPSGKWARLRHVSTSVALIIAACITGDRALRSWWPGPDLTHVLAVSRDWFGITLALLSQAGLCQAAKKRQGTNQLCAFSSTTSLSPSPGVK